LKTKGILEDNVKKMRYLLLLPMTIACFLLAGAAAKVDPLTITLDAPYQFGGVSVFGFDATVTNTSADTVYLNGDNFSVDSPLTVDDSPYLNNYPLTLGAGDSASGLLFNVDVPIGTALGLYTGYFDITGGSDANAGDTVGEADFDVNVTPEPSGWLLLGSGLAALALAKAQRRKGASARRLA
jgi:hypothetical protein